MANPLRLTRGEAIAGKLLSNTSIEGEDLVASDDLIVGDQADIAGDAYITGAFGKGVSVANIADGASMAITAAQLLGGIVTATPTEARDIQAPTAATLITAVDALVDTGLGFEFTVINLAGATHALTLTVNTGTTIIGSPTVPHATSASFIARIASGTTVVIYRK